MSNVDEQALSAKLLISSQVGEMPSFGKEGRTEGARLAPLSEVLHRRVAPMSRHGCQGLRRVASLLAPPWHDEGRDYGDSALFPMFVRLWRRVD
jgi:hypothetical protein